ncbi:endonuclease/exonuclease/phosphatase family protein [Patescibacteria group bacterium]|nr:endonuclease/exonuclease/phosphatase family protein [Patescibacteria group bacterium]
MLYRNKELDRAFDFIAGSDFDMFCLQEVPEQTLKRLQELPVEIAYRRDVEKLFATGNVSMYNVILSRHPIRASKEIPFPDYWHLLSLRSRLFVRMMRPFGFGASRDRGGIYADIDVGGTLVRIFNLHLILARPAWRLAEFERAMAKRDPSLPTIVCGDFNTLEKPHITILNMLFGSPAREAAFYRRERTSIEKRFVEHGLWNPLRGRRTHGLSRSQLDHILLSSRLSIVRSEVIPDRHGSDHHPLRAEVSVDTGVA